MSIAAVNITKGFGQPMHYALHSVSLDVAEGEFVAITGKSGSGKTTLLYILSTLDTPTSGNVTVAGADPYAMNARELHEFRNENIGFIFQFHYLLPELSALENITLPARKRRLHRQKEKKAKELMDRFDLQGKYHRLPSQLSGGEQQRVAIARALVMEPRYLFADEPTGNLDTQNGIIVMEMLRAINTERKMTVVLVTHEPDYAAMASRAIQLVDGRIQSMDT